MKIQNTNLPNNIDISSEPIARKICKQISELNAEGSHFKSIHDLNEWEQNILMFYFYEAKQLPNDYQLTFSELSFLLDNVNMNQLSINNNSAFNLAILNNDYISPNLSYDMYDTLLKTNTLSSLNSDGESSLEVVLNCYGRQPKNMPINKNQLNLLYEAHLKIKPLDETYSNKLAKVLSYLDKKSDKLLINKEGIETSFGKPSLDKEVAELKQLVLSLSNQVSILTDKINKNEAFLDIEDRPSLKTNNKINNAMDKLVATKIEKSLDTSHKESANPTNHIKKPSKNMAKI